MRTSHSRTGLIAALLAAAVFTALHHAAAENPEHVERLKKTGECARCDLTKADLAAFQGAKAVLTAADLTGATFYGGSLRDADLTGAILDGTNLEMVDLTGAVGAILGDAKTDTRTTCPDGTAGPCR